MLSPLKPLLAYHAAENSLEGAHAFQGYHLVLHIEELPALAFSFSSNV